MTHNQALDQLSDEPIYNMRAVEQQTGLSAATLRAWERRYGFPTPQRTASGYRLYSAHDIQLLQWLKVQIDAGMAISQAVALLRSLRAAGQEPAPESPRNLSAAAAPPSTQNLDEIGNHLYDAIIHFDQAAGQELLDLAFATHSVETVCLNLFQPLLRRVGQGWQQGALSVQMEHFATNMIRERLFSLLHAAPPPYHDARLVAACAPTEQHEIGLLMTALFLRRTGWPVVYLGRIVPVAGIIDTVREVRPAALLISATTLMSAPGVLDVADALASADLPPAHRPRLMYGGRIFNVLPQLHPRVPGIFAGNTAAEVAANLETRRAAPAFTAAQPVPPEPLAALAALRRRQDAITLEVVNAVLPDAPGEEDYAHVHTATHNLNEALAAALRFGEPSALAEIGEWAGSGLPVRGIPPTRLLALVQTFDRASAQLLPADAGRTVHEYLKHLAHAIGDA